MTTRIESARCRRTRLLATTCLTALIAGSVMLPASQAGAAGFALKEQSAAAQGNSFAGATAGAEDITYMFFNPAGLTRHDESQAAAVLNYIIPQGETDNAAMNPVINGAGEANSGDAAEDALVPAFYAMWSMSPDLKFALGVNTPLGLTTKYSQTWAGRYDAVESAIMTVNLNPTVAYRVNESLSLGAGLQIQYMDVTLSQMAPVAPGVDALAEITGDDWAFGATLGLLYEFSDATRAGLSYRSQLGHTLEGDFTIGGTKLANANADFTSPDMVNFGLYHDYSEQFAVMAEVQWNRWSNFDELRVVDDAGNLLALTPEDWEDVWFVALGATWKLSDDLTLRGGLAFDQSPIPDETRTPRLTGEDRTWVSVGAKFSPSPNFTIDAGYTHVFVKDSTVNLPDRTGVGGPPALTADYENSVDILAVQGVFRF